MPKEALVQPHELNVATILSWSGEDVVLRLALRRSNSIIIDLQRTKLLDEKCLRTLKRRAKKLGKKYKIMAITKTKKVVKFFQ